MDHLEELTEEQLKRTIELLRNDNTFSHLAHMCELELVRRTLPPIEEIFPEGGYVTEVDGKEVIVPLK